MFYKDEHSLAMSCARLVVAVSLGREGFNFGNEDSGGIPEERQDAVNYLYR